MTENKTPRDREESHMKMEVEMGMMLPQTKDNRNNQDLEGARKESPLEHGSANILILDLWSLEL